MAMWALASCAGLAPSSEKPVVAVDGIEPAGGNFLHQNFLVQLTIKNPSPHTLPVTRLHVELNLSGESVASGVNDRPFVVPARGETHFDMTITANLGAALLKYAARTDKTSDAVDYELTGGARIELPFLHDLKFHRSGSLPLHFHSNSLK